MHRTLQRTRKRNSGIQSRLISDFQVSFGIQSGKQIVVRVPCKGNCLHRRQFSNALTAQLLSRRSDSRYSGVHIIANAYRRQIPSVIWSELPRCRGHPALGMVHAVPWNPAWDILHNIHLFLQLPLLVSHEPAPGRYGEYSHTMILWCCQFIATTETMASAPLFDPPAGTGRLQLCAATMLASTLVSSESLQHSQNCKATMPSSL